MDIKLYSRIATILICYLFSVLTIGVYAKENSKNTGENQVMSNIKEAEAYIKKNGKEQSIAEFKKKTSSIFAIDYDGTILALPLYPEWTGTNQFNYKDPASGAFSVQEEIEKAKAGGGWLQGGSRKNSQTGKIECKKIYVHPMPNNYLIGSWYFYPSDIQGNCST